MGMVLVLVMISGNPGSQDNGFNRKFYNSPVQPLYHSGITKGVRAICGIQKNHIYFETATPALIIETDSTLSNARLLKFDIPHREMVQTLYTTFIDSSNCYIMAGNVPEVIQINIHARSFQALHLPNNLFSESILLGNDDYVFRMYEKISGRWEQIFIKANPVKNTLYKEHNISEKRGDAGFSTDGNLIFDDSTRRIIYVEYYRNQFICMDTSLHLLYKANTIDTGKHPAVKVIWNKSKQSQEVTNGSPLYEINLESKVKNGSLYIHSACKAGNETPGDFAHHAAIDVYQITNGHYRGSFYIPEFKEERLKEFEIAGNKIIALYNDYIVIYSNPFN